MVFDPYDQFDLYFDTINVNTNDKTIHNLVQVYF